MELIDVFDSDNNYLGYSLERDEVHNKNLFHHHVSAWIMNCKGEVLLQQRAFTKNKNPGKWSKTGGHVEALDDCAEAIKREVYEEIGLSVPDSEIECIEIFKSNNSSENYFAYGYIFFTDKKENEFILKKDEVESVKYYSVEEMEEIRKRNDSNYTFCNWNEDGFNKQISLLKEYRQQIISKDI